ncbi:hypothetical protein NDA16_002386 [Ustilago loliicola]|nr:hypothetical protein NDA16_002386 [Ustilago loliicola]
MLESTTSIAGFVICLGAVSQLAALVVYASQSLDKAIAYSMTIAIAISLATTFICIGFGRHQDGHLCSGRRRHSSHRNNKGAPKGAESEPTLPISDRRLRSRCSSISSHSGKYIPDYGLDSSTDSDDDDDPRTKKPRADWMDEALKDVVRSPLLDMPKRRQ